MEPINDVLLTRNLMEHLEHVVVRYHRNKVEILIQKVILFFHRIASKSCLPLFLADCSLPKAVGPCKGDFTRFHYNSATKNCEAFIYGGCDGNGNKFRTKAECETTCKA